MFGYVSSLLFTIALGVSLSIGQAIAEAPQAELVETSQAPSVHAARGIKFDSCASRALRIELNRHDRTAKVDLITALKALSDFPGFEFTPVDSDDDAVAFTARLKEACGDKRCASASGWSRLQARLLRGKGVTIACDESPSGGNQQEAPKKDDGGVTGGSGAEKGR